MTVWYIGVVGGLIFLIHGCGGVPHIPDSDPADDLDLVNYRQTKHDGPGRPELIEAGKWEEPRNLPRSRYGNPDTYTVFGKQYRVMPSSRGYAETGYASWYGSKFHGRKTSSGERYNMYDITAAHKSLPLPTFVHVTNLENGRELIVKVNDRGPFHEGRIIDLSYGAAARLDVLGKGTARVHVRAITENLPVPGSSAPRDGSERISQQSNPAGERGVRHRSPTAGTVIQVGAFGSFENAEQIRSRVNQLMQVDAAYIVSNDDQSLHKVRFGVAAAAPLEQVLALLESGGIDKYAIMDP